MRSILLILLGCFFSLKLMAQFNVKVGYSYGYFGLDTDVHKTLIDEFNTNNKNTLDDYQEMDQIKGFHGLLLGVRYRFEPVAINLGVTSMFQGIKSRGIEPVSGGARFTEHFYRVLSYSAGLEFFIRDISFGGTLDFNRLRIRAENDMRSDRHVILSEGSFSSQFFIGVNVDGNEQLSLAIQPYIQIPLTKFDLTGLESQLDSGANVDSYEDGFMNFGIRIIFQNGRPE